MKKITPVLLIAAMLAALALTGCGNAKTPEPTESPDKAKVLSTEEIKKLVLERNQICFDAMDEFGITHDEGSTKGNYPYWDLTEDDPIEVYNEQYELCIAMYKKLISLYAEQTEYVNKRLGEIDKENEPAGEWYYNEELVAYSRLTKSCEDSIAEIESLMQNGEKKVLLGEHEGPLDGPNIYCLATKWITLCDVYLEYPDEVVSDWNIWKEEMLECQNMPDDD